MKQPIQIHIDWKNKVLTLVFPVAKQLEVDEGGNVVITDEMLKVREKQPVDKFEEELVELLNTEQEIKLYRYWGNRLNRTVMVSRTANMVNIDKPLAKMIIGLAESYGLLVSGWNSTWRVPLDIIKERWVDKAKEKESYLKDPSENIELTPQEAVDALDKKGTEKQKAESRGESVEEYRRGKSRINRESRGRVNEDPVEVVPEKEEPKEKFYSAREASGEAQRERERDEKNNELERQRVLQEMNKEGQVRSGAKKLENYKPKGVSQDYGKPIVKEPIQKAQNLPNKKHVSSKPSRKR